MPVGRPAIPMQMQREVLIESGFRCAMPMCRETVVDLCHIEPWSSVQAHEAHNLIALCPVDHRRFDSGDIDRKAMRQIKLNQVVLSHRYSELERRILDRFAREPSALIVLDRSLRLLYQALVDDGVLVSRSDSGETILLVNEVTGLTISVETGPEVFLLTGTGQQLIARWVAGDAI